MRAPVTDLPIVLEDVSFVAGGVTIVDRISLVLAAGSPTVLIAVVIAVNALAWSVRRAGERYAG